jgi:hypothetical protein
VLVLALALGCGGGSAQEEAQLDWELRSGLAWKAYEEAFDRGWVQGCEAAADAIRADDSARYEEAFANGPGCGHGSTPTFVPKVPPGDPQAEGYKDGLLEGCAHVYAALGADDPRSTCPVTR